MSESSRSDSTDKWTLVTEGKGSPWYTERLKVPGGWLYRSLALYDKEDGGNVMAMCFVPDLGFSGGT